MTTPIITNNVAGPFRAYYTGSTYDGAGGFSGTAYPSAGSLGIISKGIRLIRRFEGEDIPADVLGNSVVDSVYLGGQMFLEFELEEANKTNVLALQNPFIPGLQIATPTVDPAGRVGIPGTFASSKAGKLDLKPLYSVSGTIHTTAGAQVTPWLTFGLVTLAMGWDMERLFASRRRVIPIRLRCYPYLDTTTTPDEYVWYTRQALDSTYFTE